MLRTPTDKGVEVGFTRVILIDYTEAIGDGYFVVPIIRQPITI